MILLHAAWVPSYGSREDPALFLWGEETELSEEEPAFEPVEGTIPFLTPPREVRTRLSRVADGILYECAEQNSVEILWPTLRKRPLPSRGVGEQLRRSARFEYWRVDGLTVPPADALLFLAGLPRRGLPPLEFGDTLRYWSEAATLALGLIARQRYIPTVLTLNDGSGRRQHVSRWQPVLSDPLDRQGAELLTEAMPPVCRAIRTGPDLPGEPRRFQDPSALLRGFLDSVVDAAIRQVLAEDGFPEGAGKRGPASRILTGPPGVWLRSLGWIDGVVDADTATFEPFAREVRRWNETLTEPPPGSYRTAFRLCEPGELPATHHLGGGDSGDTARSSNEGAWMLEILLQDRSAPDVLVPALSVWEEAGSVLAHNGRTFERPQDRLLEDLGRASRVFPPLERPLRSPRPAQCPLSPDEAYLFLTQAGPLLEESGFGVLLPSWWRCGESQPRLKLRLRPPGDALPSRAGDVVGAMRSDGERGIPEDGTTGSETWVAYDWQVAIGDVLLTPEEFHELAKAKEPLLHIGGRWVELRPEQTAAIDRIVEEQANRRELTLAEAIQWGTGGVDPGLDIPPPEVEAEGWVGALLDQIHGRSAPDAITMDERFHGTLRPYQERGVGWLEFMRKCGLGACLADDMGLGKTIQLIGLLLHERRGCEAGESAGSPTASIRSPGPTLVLCPMSVVGNWQREIERFAPQLKVLVHHGMHRLRDHAFAREAEANDVVISTYALCHRDRHQLRQVDWERIVLDEAQNIKNSGTLQARAVRFLRARTRTALTGTPLENRLLELWSILDVLNPGYLGSRADFRRLYAVPIERFRDPGRRELLQRLVQPFLLRRLKTDPHVIQDLPEKLEMRVYCNLTREQAGLYQAVVSEMMQGVGAAAGMARRGLILAGLTRLKQICNHPAHFLGDDSAIEDRSGKVARLGEMLEEILSVGDRALVFTQFTEMGKILQYHLSERLREEVIFLHGGTPKKARDRMVDRFQEPDGPPIFILSLRAGGTGLNLTSANHVFHFDRWWNPAVEDQATDRAFRIGQTRNVQVHKFVCVGTLEEKIDRMIQDKRDLARSIVGAGEQWLTELDTSQLREILALSHDAVSED